MTGVDKTPGQVDQGSLDDVVADGVADVDEVPSLASGYRGRTAETFKRSVSACTRAVAKDKSLNVEFVDGEFEFDARQGKLSDVTENPDHKDCLLYTSPSPRDRG